ncbi:MAG: NepR family anti-sigma factor [Paracoccaceae bacterium]|uniref:NepR family anti-sigma factor n=1 Tax=Seohaeicola saemankumensis TaxID=481181 RepID=UPI002E7C06B5|nr:NepR family anti-sigma factor [Seohaeicola saemankumensis]
MTQDDQRPERKGLGLKRQIDENLKRVYQDALEEDVPDRFKELLERLRAKETGK